MSIEQRYFFECDNEDCEDSLLVEYEGNKEDAISYAQDKGWLIIKYDHFCPLCKDKMRKHIANKKVKIKFETANSAFLDNGECEVDYVTKQIKNILNKDQKIGSNTIKDSNGNTIGTVNVLECD